MHLDVGLSMTGPPAPRSIMELPLELQRHILGSCLQGWTAQLESHIKKDGTWRTSRLWSSHVYDALMLSLTCKQFHATIQQIQRDPSLFSGDLDLIEDNGDLSCLTGDFSNVRSDQASSLNSSAAFRTMIFIKDGPHGKRQGLDWRMNRRQYHYEVRQWLLRHVSHLGLRADELCVRNNDWGKFARLQQLAVRTHEVHTIDIDDDADIPFCKMSEDSLLILLKKSGTYEYFDDRDSSDDDDDSILEAMKAPLRSGIKVILTSSYVHYHLATDAELDEADILPIPGKEFRLTLICEIDNKGWRLQSRSCNDLDSDDECE